MSATASLPTFFAKLASRAALLACVASAAFSADWVAQAPLPTPSVGTTATLLPNGTVLLAGGYDGQAIAIASQIFDPVHQTYAATATQLNHPRALQCAVTLNNGFVMVIGGYDSQNSVTGTCELYDPANGTWSLTGSMATARTQFACAVLASGKVIAAGGQDSNGTCIASAEIYDPSLGTWASAGSTTVPHGAAAGVLLGDGRFMIAGGNENTTQGGGGGSNNNPCAEVDIYDPTAGTWSAAASMHYERQNFTLTLLADNKVLAVGGNGGQFNQQFGGSFDADPRVAEIYDPVANAWTLTGSLAQERDTHYAQLLSDGTVLITGGQTHNSGTDVITSEIYNEGSGLFTAGPNLLAATSQGGLCLLPAGPTIFGGQVGQFNAFTAMVQTYGSALTDHAPVANGQSVTLAWNTSKDIALTGSDVDGNLISFQVASQPASGKATMSGLASVTYTPGPGYFGADSFTVVATDGLMTSAPATINVMVDAVPTLTANSMVVQFGGTAPITSAAIHAVDPDTAAAQLVYTVTGGLYHGSVTDNGVLLQNGSTFTQADINNGLLVYTQNSASDAAFDGMFFTLTDGFASPPGRQGIQIYINHPPVLMLNSTLSVPASSTGNAVSSNYLGANDQEQQANQLIFTVTTGFAHGSVIRDNGILIGVGGFFTEQDVRNGTVTLDAGSTTGPDSLGFTLSDGAGGSVNGSLAIAVLTATGPTGGLQVNTSTALVNTLSAFPLTGDLSTNSSVTPTSSIVYTVQTATANGTLKDSTTTVNAGGTFTQADVDAGLVTYTINSAAVASDSFTFTVSDGSLGGAGAVGILNGMAPAVVNNPFAVNAGRTFTLTSAQLSATKAGMGPDQLLYTVTQNPANGHFIYYGFQQGGSTTFTQTDINLGAVQYAQDITAGTPPTSDLFKFTVSDSLGSTTGAITETITINQGLAQRLNTGVMIVTGNNGNFQIDNTMLLADESTVTDTNITYTLITPPTLCSMQAGNGHHNGLSSGGTFTQGDIDNHNVSLSLNGITSGNDSFTFVVSDNLGHSLALQTFTIQFFPSSVSDGSGQALVQLGQSVVIDSTMIHVTNPDLTASEMVFTLNNTPFDGVLKLNGTPLGQNSTFTQADVNQGHLSYFNGNSNNSNFNSNDSFNFNFTVASIPVNGNNYNNQANVSITINHPPQVVLNAGITFAATGSAGTVVIGDDQLRATDPEQGAAQLTYTLTSLPGDGSIDLSGTPLALNGTFTQADIDAERVTFVPSSTSGDGFQAMVSDGVGGSTTVSVQIRFTSALAVLDNNLVVCQANSTVTISAADLTVARNGVPDTGIIYTVLSVPNPGQIKLSGGVLTTSAGSNTFTQNDIDTGKITYQWNSDCEADGYQLSVTDGTTTLDLMINVAINHAPTMAHKAFSALAGLTSEIDSSSLQATDPEQSDTQLVYTLTAIPAKGTLFLNGLSVGLNGTFTQQNIDDGQLDYVQDHGGSGTDTFTVSVNDGRGGVSAGQIVNVSIVSTMAITTNDPLTVLVGGFNQQGQISSGVLRTISLVAAMDNNNNDNDSNIIYSVTAFPTVGNLVLNTMSGQVTLSSGGTKTFTQDDIDRNNLQYQISGSPGNTSDSFVFDVHDQDGTGTTINSITGTTFHIVIEHQATQVTNNQITVGQGQTFVLTGSITTIQDGSDTAAQLLYTLNSPPAHGALMFMGAPMAQGSTFTQDDINRGLISYVNDGSANTFDGFNYGYGDALFPNSSGNFTNIQVVLNPTLVLNTGINVNALSSGNQIHGDALEVTDGTLNNSNIIFTVTTLPSNGSLVLNGTTTLSMGGTHAFSQNDLNSGNLAYTNSGGSGDSFHFTVSNGYGGTISDTVFSIGVNSQPSTPFVSIVNAPVGPVTYGDAAVNNVHATTTSPDVVTLTVLSGPATLVSGTLSFTGAGQVVLRATDPGSSGWNPASQTVFVQVNPKQLTVTADNLTKPYGAGTPTLTYTITGGWVGSDTQANSTTGQPQLNVNTNPSDPAGTTATININQGSLSAANYMFTTVNGLLTVGQAPLLITPNNASRTYGAPNPSFGVTYNGFVNGDGPGSLTGTLTIQNSATTATPVGNSGASYQITANTSTLANANYAITYGTGTLTITPAVLIASALNQSVAPGSTANTAAILGTTYDVTGFMNGETSAILSGSPQLSCTETGLSPPGAYAISIAQSTLAATPNYTFTLADGVLTVGHQLFITVTPLPAHASKVYGQPNPSWTGADVSYSGFVGTDNAGMLSGTLAITSTATTTSGVGSYPVSASGLSNGSNTTTYYIVYVNGTLNVTPAPVTVTANDVSRPYGSPNSGFSAFATGLVGSDTFASLGTIAYQCSANQSSTVAGGPYAITPEGLSNPNYSISYVAGNLSVTPINLTVTANNNNMPGGGPVPTPISTVTYSGFVNGDTAGSALTGTPALATTATNSSLVNSFQTITPSVGSLRAVGGDYTFTFVNGIMTVGTPLTVTVTPVSGDGTRVYGHGNPGWTVADLSFSGFTGGDTPANLGGSPSFACAAPPTAPVGSYPITVSGYTSGKYAITYVAGSLSVTRQPLTITAQPEGSAYGASIAVLGVSYAGFVNGDTFGTVLSGAPAISTTATSASAAGTYPISVSLGSLLQSNLNYQLVFVSGTYTVTPAALTVTATSVSRAYGAANPTFTFTSSGLVNGDAIGSVTEGTAATVATGVSTPAITISAAVFSSGSASNYTITYVAGTLTINPAALSVNATNASRAYGAANPTLAFTTVGLVNGDTIGSVTETTTATVATAVGTPAISISAAVFSVGSAANYTITYNAGVLTITPATLTVTATNASRAYGAANPTFAFTSSGLVNGDTIGSVTETTTATAATSAGTAAINISAAVFSVGAASNYAITYNAGVLTINPAALTVAANNASRAYGAANPALGFTPTGLVNGDTIGSVTESTTAVAATPAGTAPITISAAVFSAGSAANYTITYTNGTLTITPAALTVAANNASRAYGAANPVLGFTPTGLVNGDTIGSVTESTTAAIGSAVGPYPISISAAVFSAGTAANYAITYTNGTLTVTAAALTVTATNASRTYGAANPAFAFTSTGLVNGDTIGSTTETTTATVASNTGTYPIAISAAVFSAGTAANYAITYANGTLTVNPANLTVTGDAQGMVQGNTPPTLTYTITGFVNGDTQASALTGAPALTNPVTNASGTGTYTTTVTAGTLAANNGNYTFTFVNGSVTVAANVLTVTPNAVSMTYGSSVPALTYTITGFVGGDTALNATTGAAALSTAATSASPVGSYAIVTAIGTLAANNPAKYAFNLVNGTLTVTAATLTVTGGTQTKAYGAAVPALTDQITGFVNGDTIAVVTGAPSLSNNVLATSPVGTYTTTVGVGTLAAPNYTFATVNGSVQVTPVALTITANNQTMTQGGTVPTLTVSYTGFVNGDTSASLTTQPAVSTTATSASAAGSYVIAVVGGTDGNYVITDVNGTLTIQPAAGTGTTTSGPIGGTGTGGTSSGCGLGAGGMGIIGLMLLALRGLRPRASRRR